MPIFMIEVAYTAETWQALVKKPQNRVEAIRPAIEALGGKIINAFLVFGEYDALLICEFPDEITAAAFQIAGAAGGATKAVRMTTLMSIDDGIEAFRRAGQIVSIPPISPH